MCKVHLMRRLVGGRLSAFNFEMKILNLQGIFPGQVPTSLLVCKYDHILLVE